nr:hypothetical protein [uncultured Ilyobacter sp.]
MYLLFYLLGLDFTIVNRFVQFKFIKEMRELLVRVKEEYLPI